MATITYQVYFDNQAASADQMALIEELVVEQEIDTCWEARIRMPVYLDDSGAWTQTEETYTAPYRRVRIEVKVGDADSIALIDGPIVSYDFDMHSEPGKSTVTWIARDDSHYLDRDQEIRVFEGLELADIVQQVYDSAGEIEGLSLSADGDTIDEVSSSGDDLDLVVVQRGSKMSFLKRLARQAGMHAYVLPGDEPGKSQGYFKSPPTDAGDLPSLVLTGSNRNLVQLAVRNRAQRLALVQASSVGLSDKQIRSSESDSADSTTLGSDASVPDGPGSRVEWIHPIHDGVVDIDTLASGRAKLLAYSYEADGLLYGDQYGAVLQPYQVVQVIGANSRQSGNYLIHRVTHTLNRSLYSQGFGLLRDAASSGDSGAGGAASAMGRII